MAANATSAGAVAGGERRANTTITEVLCTYTTNQGGSLDVTIVVSWRGNDPYAVNTPIQFDTHNSLSAAFFPTRAENRANSATRTLAISPTASNLSVQAGAWVDSNGTILTWTPATPCSPAP